MNKNIIYWKSEEFPNYLIRDNDGNMEIYKKGEGWIEEPEREDLLSGIDNYYTLISEDEANEIISKIETKV